MKHLHRTVALVRAGLVAAIVAAVFAGHASAAQAPVPLGNAESFGAMSASGITNSGLDTVVNGNIGSSLAIGVGVTNPGFARYGPTDSQLTNGQAALGTAITNAAAQTATNDITGQNLAGQTLHAGVFDSTGAILISGPSALTLDGGGNADSVFIFRAAPGVGALTVNSSATVNYVNGAQPCNVFWKVNSAALSNTGFQFVGTILSETAITLTDNVTVQGRTLALGTNVTFIHDIVNRPSGCDTQASRDAAKAEEVAKRAANDAAAATAASNAAAAAADVARAADEAKAAAVAQAAADAKAAADVVAAKAASDAQIAATAAAQAAAAADAKRAKAAAAKAAAAKAVTAKKTAAKARAHAISTRNLARPAKRHVGLTG
ncbi:MAG: hypothetical protein QOK22_1275 [Gaiellaceae bacterium]|nr:hypothetical protein [Gaiellaceae bacterium]